MIDSTCIRVDRSSTSNKYPANISSVATSASIIGIINSELQLDPLMLAFVSIFGLRFLRLNSYDTSVER